MSSPVAIVTGTTSGIGLAAAIRLAQQGYTVVATVRSLDRAQPTRDAAEAAGVELDIRALEVSDLAAGRALVEAAAADHGRLDVLVNNAGRGQVGTLSQLSDEELRDAFETNFFSVAALTQAALPHLQRTGGRVVTVTSVGGVVGQPFNDAYCAAKFAVEGLMQSLAPVAARLGVGVHVVEPGPVATSFVANVGRPQESSIAEQDPVDAMFAAYTKRSEGSFANAQSADDVADVVVTAATQADQPFRLQTSELSHRFAGMSLADLDGSRVLGATSTWLG